MRVRFQTKILLLVLAGVSLPALLMGFYLLQRNEELLAEKVQETLSNHLFRASAQIDDWMQQRLHEVSRWSASFVHRAMLSLRVSCALSILLFMLSTYLFVFAS